MNKLLSYLALSVTLSLSQATLTWAETGPQSTSERNREEVLKEAWNNINDPFVVNPQFSTSFESLPLSGQVKLAPWSDSYWPTYQGGIAYRWNSSRGDSERLPFNRESLTGEDIKSMSQFELAALSPAEKYDVYMGNFDFPTLKRELQRTSSSAEKWEGICHGWAAAATNFQKEPGPVVLKGPSGIAVPFGSSDIKALLSYYQGELSSANSLVLGSRCEGGLFWHIGRHFLSSSCRDVNAGAFHVVLTNMIGKEGKSFVADMTTGKEVWNFPIYAYESKIVKVRNHGSFWAARGTVKEIEFKTDIYYSVETEAEWKKTGNAFEKKTLNYRVELNNRGEIIGGEWEKFERPDFLWVQEQPQFTGYYGQIEKIYKASIMNP